MTLIPTLHKTNQQLRTSLLAVAVLFCLTGKAQIVGNWNFNGTTAGTAGTLNTVSIADFSSAVPTVSFNAGVEYFGQNGWPTGTLDPAMYIEFTLTPNAGYALNISSVNLKLRHSNTGPGGGSGPTRFSLRSNLDGYATDIASGNVTGAYATHTITPGYAYTNLPSAITFRVYGYLAMIYTGGNSRFVFDNIDVEAIGVLLPAQLMLFTAQAASEKVIIRYMIQNSSIGSVTVLERSQNGTSFSELQTFTQNSPASIAVQNFIDESLPADATQLFYRLKMYNAAGTITYSSVITVRFSVAANRLRAFVSNERVTISGEIPANAEIRVIGNSGVLISTSRLNNKAGNQSIILPIHSTGKGIIYLFVIGKTGRQIARTVVL